MARDVIVGEPLHMAPAIITGQIPEADLLYRDHLPRWVPIQTRFECFLAEGFSGIGKKGDRLEEETSPSRVALKLKQVTWWWM